MAAPVAVTVLPPPPKFTESSPETVRASLPDVVTVSPEPDKERPSPEPTSTQPEFIDALTLAPATFSVVPLPVTATLSLEPALTHSLLPLTEKLSLLLAMTAL